MNFQRAFFLIIAFTVLLAGSTSIFYGCKNFSGPTETTTTTTTDTTIITPVVTQPVTTSSVICFSSQVLPLLQSNCGMSGCHDALSRRDGYDFSTYQTSVSRGVVAGNADRSAIYTITVSTSRSRMPPSPYNALTDAQRAILRQWITEGAKNTNCSPTACDTSSVTYARTILPALQTYCVGCHSTASPGGGINLSTYAGIKTVATNGKLLGSITRQSGFIAMPPSGSLGSCETSQFRIWIRGGALNN